MEIKFLPGLTVYKDGSGLVWVSPHSGPGFYYSDSRDEHTDVIAGLCWNKLKGTLVVSNISRIRGMGIDFNRIPPKAKDAIKFHNLALTGSCNQEAVYNFKNKYAWIAVDTNDHDAREKIYNSFWENASKGDTVVLIHRMFTSPKTMKSFFDFFACGFDEKPVKRTVKEVNENYRIFFKSVRREYFDFLLFEEKRKISFVNRTSQVVEDHEIYKAIRDHRKILNVKNNSDIIFHLKKVIEKTDTPEVTYSKIFNGSLSSSMDNLKNKRIIQIEVSSFLCKWYPDTASEIICSIVSNIMGGSK